MRAMTSFDLVHSADGRWQLCRLPRTGDHDQAERPRRRKLVVEQVFLTTDKGCTPSVPFCADCADLPRREWLLSPDSRVVGVVFDIVASERAFTPRRSNTSYKAQSLSVLPERPASRKRSKSIEQRTSSSSTTLPRDVLLVFVGTR